MNSRFLSLLLSAGLLTVLISGCGSAPAEQEAQATADPLPAAEESTAPAELAPVSGTETVTGDTSDIDPDNLTGDQLKLLSQNYYVSIDYEDSSLRLNGMGQLTGGSTPSYKAITDVLTGETVYYSATYSEYTRTGEYDYTSTDFSRLYAADGTLLADWAETSYGSAIGDWVTSYTWASASSEEDFYSSSVAACCLLDPLTGETREGIMYIYALDDSHALALDGDYLPVGVLDSTGAVSAVFSADSGEPNADCSYSTVCGYVSSENYVDGSVRFYDADLQLVASTPAGGDCYVSTYGITAPYVYCGGCIYDLSQADGGELTPLYESDSIDYYDGDTVIISTFDADGNFSYLLTDSAGNTLAGPFEDLTYRDQYTYETEFGSSAQKAEFFYARQGSTVSKLAPDGTVLAEFSCDGLCSFGCYVENGIVIYTDDWNDACLLDDDLNMVIPFGTYSGFNSVTTDGSGYLSATYYLSDFSSRCDLLAPDGTVVFSGASVLSDGNNGLISVSKGFSVGLIDYEGNWVCQYQKADLTNMD